MEGNNVTLSATINRRAGQLACHTYFGEGTSLRRGFREEQRRARRMQCRKLLFRNQYKNGLTALCACPSNSVYGSIRASRYLLFKSRLSEVTLYGSQHTMKTTIRAINIRATLLRPSMIVELLSEVLRWNSSEQSFLPIRE